MNTTFETYIPKAPAGAELLQLAFENLLRGDAEPQDIVYAIQTAFRGVQRYGITQDAQGGQFCASSVRINDVIGAQGFVFYRPVVLAEHHELGLAEISLDIDFALNPLFEVYPLQEASHSND